MAQAAAKPIDVVCYSPYRDGQSPDNGQQPSVEQIREDFRIIAPYVKGIRTYSTLGIHAEIPRLASEAGLEVWLGAWIGTDEAANQKQVDALIQQAGGIYKSTIKGLIVGNELFYRPDVTKARLLEYIRQVKAANTGIQVTTSDNYGQMITHSADLAHEIDFVMVHIHPYWDGLNIDGSAAHVVNMWNSVRVAYPGKQVIVSETGYPSAGEQRKINGNWVGGIPSLANQTKVTVDLLTASRNEGMMVMLFSAFDEKWKEAEGVIGGSWGLWRSDRSDRKGKPIVDQLLALGPVAIATPDRKLRVIPAADAALGGIDALGRLRLPGAAVGAPAKALPVWTISRP